MAFKFVLVLAFISAASAGYVPSQQLYQAAPLAVAQPVLAKQVEEYDPHPQYKFAYDVQDAITGDSKNQVEVRDGDVVQGEYSLNDADGYRRIVRYTADDVHGFNAVVTRVPIGSPVKTIAAAPAVVKTVSPVVVAKAAAPVSFAAAPTPYAAPAYYKSAPAVYAAPTVVKSLAPVTYSAPAYYKAAPVAYSTPTYYKSAPVSYAAPAVVKTYSAPAQYNSSPLTYVSQAEVKSAVPISYSAPAYYKSAQVGYAAPSAYVAAPAVAYSQH